MKTLDKDSCIKELKKIYGITIDSNTETIIVFKGVELGKGTWGKIEYLKNYYGYKFVYTTEAPKNNSYNKSEKRRNTREKKHSNKGNILNTMKLNLDLQ